MNTLFQSEKIEEEKMRLVDVSVWSLLICLYGSHAYILLVSILTEPNIWLLVYLAIYCLKYFCFKFQQFSTDREWSNEVHGSHAYNVAVYNT